MNKYKILIGLWLLVSPAMAQQDCPPNTTNSPCCNGVISTDPRNGGTVNIDRPNIIHKFNWMDPNGWKAYFSPYFISGGGAYTLPNLFTNCEVEYLRYLNLANYGCNDPKSLEKLDFYPEDGWELLHRQNGLDLNETTLLAPNQSNRNWPYYILYNKYRGKVRLVGISNRQGLPGPYYMAVNMGFVSQRAGNISALMSTELNDAQTLDQKSQRISSTMVSVLPNYPEPFVADFTVGYDPCSCGRTPDDISFIFATLDSAHFTVGGRLTGYNTSTNKVYNTTHLFNIYEDNKIINGGSQTYHMIDFLVDKYKQTPFSSFEKLVLEGAKRSNISNSEPFGYGLSTGLHNLYCNYAYDTLNNVISKIGLIDENRVPKGFLKDGGLSLGALATTTNHLNGLVFIPPQGANQGITVVEPESTLTGSLYNVVYTGNATIRLTHPGSLSGNTNVTWQNYPFYNEALGVVSFLKQPKAQILKETLSSTSSAYIRRVVGEQFSLQLTEDLEYYFNPTLDVDLEKTKVLAAYVIDMDKKDVRKTDEINMPLTEPFAYENKLGSFNRVIDLISSQNVTNSVQYITDFYPIECLKDVKAFFQRNEETKTTPNRKENYKIFNISSPKNIKLRVLLDIHYKSNKYGKENRHNLLYTFPLITTSVEAKSPNFNTLKNLERIDKFPFIEIIKDSVFTENTEIRAWQFIGVSGNIRVSAGKTLKLIAPKIEIGQGINLPPNVEIIYTTNTPTGCSTLAKPVSSTRIKEFCSSSEYKANSVQAFQIPRTPKDTLVQGKTSFNLSVMPNPFRNDLLITYNLKKETEMTITLYNILGQEIVNLRKGIQIEGNYQDMLITSNLPSGVYFITLRTPQGIETKKVIKE